MGLSAFDFNEEAISAYEKLGFVVEGRYRQAIKRNSGFHDAILMSILKTEWEPAPLAPDACAELVFEPGRRCARPRRRPLRP